MKYVTMETDTMRKADFQTAQEPSMGGVVQEEALHQVMPVMKFETMGF